MINTKRKNKKILIGLVIIIVACVATYFIGNAIYDTYQQDQINNRYEKSRIIDKKMKKLGYKTVVVNSVGYSLEKETSSETHELMFQLKKDLNATDEELATWAAWNMNKDYEAN